MVNSYVHVEPKTSLTQAPQITAQEAQRRFRQGEFLKRNHHLISPWMYTPQQYEARNRALFLMETDAAIARRDAAKAKSFEDIHGVGYAP